jgi:hypothetical protein
VTHTLITSAKAWGGRYQKALDNLLTAFDLHTKQFEDEIEGFTMNKADTIVMVQKFMSSNSHRPYVASLVYLIQNDQLDEMDVEDMLIERIYGED